MTGFNGRLPRDAHARGAGILRGIFVGLALLAISAGQGWLPSPLQAQEPLEVDSFGYPRGFPDAPVQVVEFGDFGCSACATFATESWADFQSQFIETGIVAWRFIPFDLGSFRNSEEAAIAAECVADLGPEAFWAMHDILYERQADWNRVRRPKDQLRTLAELVGIDGEAFEECYEGDAAEDRVDRNNDVAKDLGVRATPTFFINGRVQLGAPPLAEWRVLIEAARAGLGASPSSLP